MGGGWGCGGGTVSVLHPPPSQVGGGIIGLATARELLRRHPALTVAVLEKESEVAAHQTGHNSGVIHAGMYYAPGSIMARTCVRGSALMYEYARAQGIPHSRCGKLIVATSEAEHAQVLQLHANGTANGVPGLRVLDAAGVRELEPAVAAYSALWSPNTGIIDYAAVARHLAEDVLRSGRADIKLGFEATGFALAPGGGGGGGGSAAATAPATAPATPPTLVTVSGVEPGQVGPTRTVRARHVITCAGFHADRVAARAGGAPDPRVVTFRGTYYQMAPAFKDIVRTNVYPVPSGGGIPTGVHFTPTVNEQRGHQMIIGPGACITFSREGYTMSDVRGVGVGRCRSLALVAPHFLPPPHTPRRRCASLTCGTLPQTAACGASCSRTPCSRCRSCGRT